MIEAIVFDFDGLITDTEGPVYEAWASLYRDLGQELTLTRWSAVVGHGPGFFDPFGELELAVGHPLDRERLQRERRARETVLVNEKPALPGVQAWIAAAQARGLRLAIASSSARRWVEDHLARLGISAFTCISAGDSVERTKPAPDLYLAACRCLRVPPSRALAIEDSGVGLRAAKSAGLRCIAVPGPLTAGHDFGLADLRLTSLAERSLDCVLAELDGAPELR